MAPESNSYILFLFWSVSKLARDLLLAEDLLFLSMLELNILQTVEKG